MNKEFVTRGKAVVKYQVKSAPNPIPFAERFLQMQAKISSYNAIVKETRRHSKIYRGSEEPAMRSIRNTAINQIQAARASYESSFGLYQEKTLSISRSPSKRILGLIAHHKKVNYSSSSSFNVNISVSPQGDWKVAALRGVKELNNKIRDARRSTNYVREHRKSYYIRSLNTYIQYTTIGGVFTQPGTILRLAQQIRSRIVYTNKTPKTTDRHIAVEIECFGNLKREDLGIELTDAGLEKFVQVKEDGSIRPNKSTQSSYEIVVIAKANEFKSIVKQVCDVLVKAGCNVNKTCGLHVHLDARSENAHTMFSNLVSAQTVLYKMQPESRRENTYCKPTKSKSLMRELNKSSRYLGINPMSFHKYRTIEVRLHSGTIDATKITNFVELLEKIAYRKDVIKRAASTLNGFVKQYELPSSLATYVESRIQKFSSPQNSETEEAI